MEPSTAGLYGPIHVRWLAVAITLLLAAPATAHASTDQDEIQAVVHRAIRTHTPSAKYITMACRTTNATHTTCNGSWTTGRRSYTGTVALTITATASQRRYRYVLTATGRAVQRVVRLRRHGTITVAIPAGTSSANPVPLGAATTVGNWKLTVAGVTPDASAQVQAENMFNDPPAPDHQFFMVTVTATYLGTGSDRFDADLDLRAVGAGAVGYTAFDNDCGVIPSPVPQVDTFTGGTVTGNVCWDIDRADASSLVMYDQGDGFGDPFTWFALR